MNSSYYTGTDACTELLLQHHYFFKMCVYHWRFRFLHFGKPASVSRFPWCCQMFPSTEIRNCSAKRSDFSCDSHSSTTSLAAPFRKEQPLTSHFWIVSTRLMCHSVTDRFDANVLPILTQLLVYPFIKSQKYWRLTQCPDTMRLIMSLHTILHCEWSKATCVRACAHVCACALSYLSNKGHSCCHTLTNSGDVFQALTWTHLHSLYKREGMEMLAHIS